MSNNPSYPIMSSFFLLRSPHTFYNISFFLYGPIGFILTMGVGLLVSYMFSKFNLMKISIIKSILLHSVFEILYQLDLPVEVIICIPTYSGLIKVQF